MTGLHRFTEEAEQVLSELTLCDLKTADALLLLNDGVLPVRGLLNLLNQPDKFAFAPAHKDDLPKTLYPDVVYLRPFADIAHLIRAPYGVETVYRFQPHKKRGRTGAYKLPAPKTR